MIKSTLSDFTALINKQINAHNQLTDHLVQIEGVFEFFLTSDFSQTSTAALQAQLITMDKLIHEASRMNAILQADLMNHVLPHLAALQ